MISFQKLCDDVFVPPLLLQIAHNADLWAENQIRQTPGSPHVDTETIFLRWCEKNDVVSIFTDLVAVDGPARARLPAVEPLLELIMSRVGGLELGRAMIVNLKPGGVITRHADEGDYADKFERFHLCLQSEPGNAFYSYHDGYSGEWVHMRSGELWWFNHKREHSVFNPTAAPRLHLIVDVVAPAYRRERGS